MSRFPLFCITFGLLMVSSALSQDVRYNFDDTIDFSRFKTYKWVGLGSPAPIEKLTDEQIKHHRALKTSRIWRSPWLMLRMLWSIRSR